IKDCITDFNYSPVLNNRWSMTDEIDADWYTTRRVEGILVIAGTGNADDPNRLNVNMYRDWVVPKLQNGFKRESMRFQSSVDGLKLMYEIVDREVFASCPIPGTTWEGTYELSTGDGVQTFASINLRVQGPKNVDRAALINLILAIANQKLPNDKLVGLLRSAAIIEYMHQNAFEFRATMLMPMSDYKGSNSLFAFSNTTLGVPLDVQTRVIGFDAGNVPFVLNVGPLPGAPPPGAPPGAPPSGNYDSGVSPVPPPYGTVLQIAFGLFSPPLQSPCQLAQKTSELQPTNQSSPNQPPPQPPSSPTPGATTPSDPAVTFTIGAVPDDLIAESQYNIEQVNYSQYLIDAHYDNPTMVAMLPIAASPVSGSTPVVSAVFVQLAPPQCRRRVRITAERFNNWPLMPDLDVYRGPTPFIDSNGIMIVLLDEQLIPKAPQQAPSGADKIYSIEGEYLFGYSRKPDPANGDVLFTGSQPFLSSNLFESSVPPDIYETGIIE
ncbi:MAG: hypothetical protein ACREQ5_10415, partial [Candidatus Dormibacteria bacterium]